MGATDPGGRKRLPRVRRVTRGPEILAVLKQGKRSGTSHLDVFHFTSPVSHFRVGWIVPKYGHSSVERNLVKRRIKEILRQTIVPRLESSATDLDVIVRARRNAYGVSYAELKTELEGWADRLWPQGC